jgi:uncharacterized membrane protein
LNNATNKHEFACSVGGKQEENLRQYSRYTGNDFNLGPSKHSTIAIQLPVTAVVVVVLVVVVVVVVLIVVVAVAVVSSSGDGSSSSSSGDGGANNSSSTNSK